MRRGARRPLTAIGLSAALGAAAASACGPRERATADASPAGGTVVIVVPASNEPLFPPTVQSVATQEVIDQLFETLARVDTTLDILDPRHFTPQLADGWRWTRDSLAIAFHIDPRARWHDGVPVRAEDVRFTYRTYRDTAVGSPSRDNIAAIDSVTVSDSLTAVVWFSHRYPYQFYDAATQMYVLPSHLLAGTAPSALAAAPFGQHPVGSGRFRFVRWSHGATLALAADTANHRGRPPLDNVIWSTIPDYQGGLVSMLAGDADVDEVIHPDDVPAIAKRTDLRLVPYGDPSYVFLGFNLRRPLLADRAMRRALTLALDRRTMLRNVFDTLAVVPGAPITRGHVMDDPSLVQLPYDTVAADHLLDSLGWRQGADGLRRRGGRPLQLDVLVPTSSKGRSRYAVLIQAALRQIGVTVAVTAVDYATFLARRNARQFDSYLDAYHIDPSPASVKQAWTTGAIAAGVNLASYRNPRFDALVDSGLATSDLPAARGYFARAFRMIDDDAPAVWLFQPLQVAAIQRRIRTGALRSDGWWLTIADWSIPPGERIARDRIGLPTR